MDEPSNNDTGSVMTTFQCPDCPYHASGPSDAVAEKRARHEAEHVEALTEARVMARYRRQFWVFAFFFLLAVGSVVVNAIIGELS